MTLKLRAALYLRVSTSKQAEQDVSIPDQRRQGEAYCESRGFDLVETYVEPGASATTDRRPEFQRMIEAGMAKPSRFDVIVVHSFSRFFRDHFELEFHVRKLAKNGVKLMSITQEIGDDPVHVMMRQIMALFDEYQSKENAKHTLRAMKENARQGFWNGALPPIGYRLVLAELRGLRAKKKLEIDPLHAETVRLMFRLANTGDGDGPLGVKAIAHYLNSREMFTRSGGRWGVGTVHQILTRRSYMGVHEFNRIAKGGRVNPDADVITVAVPPLVDPELFDAVQARLKSRRPDRMNPAMAGTASLLTGILRCAACGGAMTVMTGKRGRYRYYSCGNRRRQGLTSCSAGPVRLDHLDEVMARFVQNQLLDADAMEAILEALLDRKRTRVTERQRHIGELNRRAAEAQQRLSRLYEAIENGVADPADVDLAGRIDSLKAARDLANAEATKAGEVLKASGIGAVSPEMLAEFTTRARKRVRAGGPKQRRDLLHRFVQRIEVHDRLIRVGGKRESLLKTVVSLGNEQVSGQVPSAVLKWLPG